MDGDRSDDPDDLAAAIDRARIEHVAGEQERARTKQDAQRTLAALMRRVRQELLRRSIAAEMKTFIVSWGGTGTDALGHGMRFVQGGRDTSSRVVEDVEGWDIPIGAELAKRNPSFEG